MMISMRGTATVTSQTSSCMLDGFSSLMNEFDDLLLKYLSFFEGYVLLFQEQIYNSMN
jgi:hypothetical protein